MATTEIVLLVTAIANGVSAVLAWLAKLYWSKEHQAATRQIIEAKEAEIRALRSHNETLQQLNPKEIADWYGGMRTMFSAYTDGLHQQLAAANHTIATLEQSGRAKDQEIAQARNALGRLQGDVTQLDIALAAGKFPSFATVVRSGAASEQLAETTAGAAPSVKLDFNVFRVFNNPGQQ